MFRANMGISSGETTVFMPQMVLVILCGWLSGMQEHMLLHTRQSPILVIKTSQLRLYREIIAVLEIRAENTNRLSEKKVEVLKYVVNKVTTKIWRALDSGKFWNTTHSYILEDDLWQRLCVTWLRVYVRHVTRPTKNKIPLQKNKLKVKGNAHPRTGHEGPEGELRYNFTFSLTSALDVGGCSTPHPGRFTPGKDAVTII